MAHNDAGGPGYTLAELAAKSGATLAGDGAVRVTRVATLERASPGAIAFLANPKYASQLASTRASAVIVGPGDADRTPLPKLVTPTPYLAYARVATLLHPPTTPMSGVHPTAVVDAGATIATGVAVGPHATVAAGAVIGEGASIGAGAAIGRDVRIGARTRIDARVVIYEGCVIGADVIVYAGAVIGADGFGLAEDQGRWLRVPQVGRVAVGDRVEIGANTTIDRGAIDDTVIGDDVKLDNLIQIGHNCVIGDGTAIAGCTGIAGSTRIGKRCRIGGAVSISGHLSIPDGTTLGGMATVMSSIEKPGVYSGAYPLQPFGAWARTSVRLRHLDELAARVAALERALRRRDGGER